MSRAHPIAIVDPPHLLAAGPLTVALRYLLACCRCSHWLPQPLAAAGGGGPEGTYSYTTCAGIGQLHLGWPYTHDTAGGGGGAGAAAAAAAGDAEAAGAAPKGKKGKKGGGGNGAGGAAATAPALAEGALVWVCKAKKSAKSLSPLRCVGSKRPLSSPRGCCC